MTFAYLSSADTLPGHPARRTDAYEHDQMMDALRAAADAAGTAVVAVAWDDVDPDAYDAAIIGTTWDYQDRCAEFVEALQALAARCPVFNPPSMVRWNTHKGYLRDLEARGVPVVETRWVERVDEAGLAEAFADLGTDRLVVKRPVGACAVGQHLVTRGGPAPRLDEPMMVQRFLPTIASEGELSFVFVDGRLSHALQKRPAAGDYRVQSLYGGVETPIEPTPADLATARGVLDAVDELPLYARVDLVRGEDGALRLMELELVEPFLYPLQGPMLGPLLVEGALRRVR